MASIQIILVIGAAGLLICVVCLIALHFLPTGWEPVADPVSNYGVSRYRRLYQIQAFSSGVCAACLWLWFAGAGIALPVWGTICLAFYALSRMLIIFFPTDVQPPRTPTGTVHMILATFTFAGIALAAGTLTTSLASTAIWAKFGWELRAAARLTDLAAIGFVVVFAVRPLRRIAGLVERGIYLGALVWLGFVLGPLLGSH
jgi:hypothetical protein